MARLVLDATEKAFLDVVPADRRGDIGAVVCLRVPGGGGRSPLVLHAECFFRDGGEKLRQFVAALAPDAAGEVALLYNDRISFSFLRDQGGGIFFEARVTAVGGELRFRSLPGRAALREFHRKLNRALCALLRSAG